MKTNQVSVKILMLPSLPYVLSSSSDLSDLDEKPKFSKGSDNQDYKLDYKITMKKFLNDICILNVDISRQLKKLC